MDLSQKGEFVFNELVWRSFLQDLILVRDPTFRAHMFTSTQKINGCKMHDLMHDLAKDVANECATAEDFIQQKISINDVRHLQIFEEHQLDKTSQSLRGTINLRTLLIPSSWEKAGPIKTTLISSSWDKDLAKSKLMMPSRALRRSCRFLVNLELQGFSSSKYIDNSIVIAPHVCSQ